ncbi:MAG: hypothetical protein Q7T55_18460 [Solirubrobacteraceae bacterium]|nr:hypothetical protein [Solirubrobacteraceae bacterium]
MSPAPRTSEPKPSCEGCFFGRQKLCALELDSPCATFRPDGPDGLQPQRQLRFAFRVADGATPELPRRHAPRRSPRRTPGIRTDQPILTPAFAG